MNNQPTRLWPILLATALIITFTGVVHAAPSEQQWKELNHSIVNQHILPRYQRLKNTSAELATTTNALCLQPGASQLKAAQHSFHQTMDAWQSIQHVQFGPIENMMRNFSMQFWPDKKNIIGKQLNLLLKAKDPDTLKTDYLYKASIGVKGLPALERLLFNDTELTANSYHCQLAGTIAAYIAENNQATLEEWQNNYAASIDQAGSDASYYDDHQEAAVAMMKSLVEPVEGVRDQKILRPLGSNGKLRAKRSESWRSQRSLRNIQLNIDSLKHLYAGTTPSIDSLLRAQGGNEQAKNITLLFNSAEQQLKEIPGPLITTLKQARTVEQLNQLAQTLKQLDLELASAMQIFNIQLGFNSRDGD